MSIDNLMVCQNCSATESTHMPNIDNMGREKIWEQENNGLALKIFKEECCSNCICCNNE